MSLSRHLLPIPEGVADLPARTRQLIGSFELRQSRPSHRRRCQRPYSAPPSDRPLDTRHGLHRGSRTRLRPVRPARYRAGHRRRPRSDHPHPCRSGAQATGSRTGSPAAPATHCSHRTRTGAARMTSRLAVGSRVPEVRSETLGYHERQSHDRYRAHYVGRHAEGSASRLPCGRPRSASALRAIRPCACCAASRRDCVGRCPCRGR